MKWVATKIETQVYFNNIKKKDKTRKNSDIPGIASQQASGHFFEIGNVLGVQQGRWLELIEGFLGVKLDTYGNAFLAVGGGYQTKRSIRKSRSSIFMFKFHVIINYLSYCFYR